MTKYSNVGLPFNVFTDSCFLNDRERNGYLMYVFTITNSAKNISEEAVHHWNLQTKLKYIANYNCLVYYVVDNNTTKTDLIG